MRKLGTILPLVLLLVACGPGEPTPEEEPAVPVEVPVEKDTPPEELVEETLPGTLFDAREASVGDVIGGWTIETLEITPHAVGEGYSATVQLEGSALLSGTYERHHGDEMLGDLITFRPDEASSDQMPRLTIDERFIWFSFENQGRADELLPAADRGEATIEISSYTIHFAPSDVHNTAVIEAVR